MAEKITNDTIVNSTELAVVLSVSVRRVQQMVQDGTLTTVERGKFNLSDAVGQYIRFLTSGQDSEEARKTERARTLADLQIKSSKATIEKLRAEEVRGNMHRAEDVKAMTEDLVYTIRSAIMALPGRLAVDVAAAGSPSEASEIIKSECYKVMRELSRYHYDPKAYEKRVRERMEWSEREDDEE